MYTIRCNENQLRAINAALEEYFRLRMGQFHDLAEDLAMLNYDKKLNGSFEKMLQRRDAANLILRTAYEVATENRAYYGLHTNMRTKTSAICEDVWQVIRRQLWLDDNGPEKSPWSVDGRTPVLESNEPLVVVTKETDNTESLEERKADDEQIPLF